MRVKPVAATMTTAMVLFLLATPAAAQMDGTAADVVDRDSLMQFVQRAKTAVDQAASDAAGAYDFADMAFRPQGDWNQGSIYIFILKTNGVAFFHGASIDLEGVSFWDRADRNGVLYAQALIRVAEAGGGFVEYVFDNPDVMGDEEAGSPKVSYAALLTFEDEIFVIGSGFYPAMPTPFAPPIGYVVLTLLLTGAGWLRLRCTSSAWRC